MSQISFPKLEEEILDWWEKEKIFAKTLDKDSPQGEFVFYEGPPTANGQPGIHHVLARAFKDLIPRYKTMRGFHVRRKAGWDTHGLPVELQVEKQLGISGKPDIENLKTDQTESIKYFNEQCKSSVWQYKEDWEKLTRRMGFWIDMDDPYITYDNDYIETLWWIISQINERGYLYKGHKVVPHCPRCGTALSSHEVALGYRSVEEPSVFLKFKITKGKGKIKPGDFILSWTTTPWTLPGNVALAVGSDFDYVKIRVKNNESGIKEDIVLAKARLDVFDDCELLEKFKGSELVGVEYEPLFPGAIPESVENYRNAFKVYPADFVTTEDGTGVVHTAVMYGEDDYNLGEDVKLPKYHTVDEEGKFKFENKQGVLGKLNGLFVKHKDKQIEEKTTELITEYLKANGSLLRSKNYLHDYPFCWRCDTPLLYYAKDSWFIKMSALRERLIKNNQEINWVPAHIKTGRFGEWLDGVKDWAISRERYWGTPLPIWQCQKCGEVKVIGSVEELEKLSGQKIKDLHRPFVDELTFPCDKCEGKMVRDASVIDCWFDSGAMPFAQIHYPFVNQELIDEKKWYPADFICEAIDQTRGWFYTLLAIGTLLGKGTPYKNVICLGHINDKDGKKMSKSLGNIVNPWEIMEKYGADALRWHMYTINQPGEPKNFDPQAVNEVLKKNWLILWNVLSFYKLSLQTFPKLTAKPEISHVLDRWILASQKVLVKEVTQSLDEYDITAAARKIGDFINILSTWYVRRSRDRFKAGSNEQAAAVVTLGRVLFELSKLLAPFVPMTAEKLYQELKADCPVKDKGLKLSVHLEDWPDCVELVEADKLVLQQMVKVRQIVEQALAARAQAKIKIRQPLAKLYISDSLPPDLKVVVSEEINVKEVVEAEQFKLDTDLNEDLKLEGILREITRKVNFLRKQAGLTVADKIDLYFSSSSQLAKKMLQLYEADLKRTTLAKNIIIKQPASNDKNEVQLEDGSVWLEVSKK